MLLHVSRQGLQQIREAAVGQLRKNSFPKA
jgi:hypothetical protein